MLTDALEVNEDILKRFVVLNKKNKLAHAYLFVGPSFSAKSETALAIAQLINCEKNPEGQESLPCKVCSSCIKMQAGNHPDMHIYQSDYGETIKVETIRAILEQTQLRPFEAKKKVFIVKNVENVTLEGANAFLKTLEEPSGSSLLILTTSQPEKILATIRSRCHSVHFSTTSSQSVKKSLQNIYDLTEIDSHFLSYFAEGCLGKAKWLNDADFIVIKNQVIDEFIISRNSEEFLKKILADKEKTKGLLEILLSWIRDAIFLKANINEEQIIHRDRLKDLNYFVSQYTFTDLKEINDEIVKANKLLTDNLNIKIPLMVIKEKLWVN